MQALAELAAVLAILVGALGVWSIPAAQAATVGPALRP
jgi:hypothetical protein